MNDISGRIFSIIFGVIFMFFVPLTLILQTTDKIAQRYVDNSIEKFKNTCLTSGQITEENYQRLISDLSNTGYAFSITLEHYNIVDFSDYNGDLSSGYIGHGNDEIIDIISSHISTNEHGSSIIQEGSPYKMNKGDYLNITATSNDTTYGTKIANAMTFGAIKQNKIYSFDSGMVQSNG